VRRSGLRRWISVDGRQQLQWILGIAYDKCLLRLSIPPDIALHRLIRSMCVVVFVGPEYFSKIRVGVVDYGEKGCSGGARG